MGSQKKIVDSQGRSVKKTGDNQMPSDYPHKIPLPKKEAKRLVKLTVKTIISQFDKQPYSFGHQSNLRTFEKVIINHESFKHSIRTEKNRKRDIRYLIALKAILKSHYYMKGLFKAGIAKEEQLKLTKNNRPNEHKQDWRECWHITQQVSIGNHKYIYDFTVFKNHKGETVLYDLKLE